MIEQGTRATPQTGTIIDHTSDQGANTYIEPGKIYSGNFMVTGLLSGNEQQTLEAVSNMIIYPTESDGTTPVPGAQGICVPTYIMVDSSSGTAYAEWKVNDSIASAYGVTIAPVVLVIYIVAILSVAIILAWLLSIVLQKATEFVAAAGPSFNYIAIAIALAAASVVIVASVYAYHEIVSDKPILASPASSGRRKNAGRG